MSAVMSSCGKSPGTRPFTWMPYGPHSTASDSVRFFTPGLRRRRVDEARAARPRVRRADVDDRARRARGDVAAAELTRAEERAVERDVDDGAPRVRRHVLGRHREVRGRVVDQHAGQPELGLGGVERGRDLLGVADVARDGRAPRAPIASIAARPASRCSGLRLAITIAAPSRANSAAIALPSPVPAPVTNTGTPSNVPAGNAVAPTAGGAGSPISSAHVLSSR